VLRKRSVKEKDEVVILLTKHHGKMSFMSYGSRDPKSRKAGSLELFNTIAFEARQGRTPMPTLQQIKPLQLRAFSVVREGEELESFYQASEMLRLTDELVHDSQNVLFVYNLLNSALDAVQQSSSSLVYWIHLLNHLGYLPEWHCCSHCQEDLELDQEIVLSSSHRGFAHQHCCDDHIHMNSGVLEKDLIKVMAYWQRERFDQGVRVDVSQKVMTTALQFLSHLELHD